jgi:hypothetical protein
LKTFFKYLVINLVLIPIYILLFFMAAMGLGGRTGTESNGELIYNIFLFSTVGIIPNAIVFLVSFIRKKNIKPNAIWATVFSLIIMIGYMLACFVRSECRRGDKGTGTLSQRKNRQTAYKLSTCFSFIIL